MVATAKRALDALTGREPPTTDLERRWVERTKELSIGPDGYQISYELQQATLSKRVETALAATPAIEFHLVELLALNENLPSPYVESIRWRLSRPDRELQLVAADELAAVYALSRAAPARFQIKVYNDARGSSWADTASVPLATLAERFLTQRTTLANWRRDLTAADAETATSDAALDVVGPRVQAALVACGQWPLLLVRNPTALDWLEGAKFPNWVTNEDGKYRPGGASFITPLATVDGLRRWLFDQLAAASEKGA